MQEAFKARVLERVRADPRVEGLLLAGSGASGSGDRFSDLDFVVVIQDNAYGAIMSARREFAVALGDLSACFTGEHVGEPRLLICLFGVPEDDRILHVDLKFVRVDDLAERVDEPTVLLDRAGACARALALRSAFWPDRDPQWFEDRIWIWLHYGAARLGRGERYEALSMVNWLREQVLAPMLSRRAGLPQRGLRRIEALGAEAMEALDSTLGDATAASLWKALGCVRELYLSLREDAPPPNHLGDAETRVTAYISNLSDPRTSP